MKKIRILQEFRSVLKNPLTKGLSSRLSPKDAEPGSNVKNKHRSQFCDDFVILTGITVSRLCGKTPVLVASIVLATLNGAIINAATTSNGILLECTNRLNPSISDIQLVNNGTIQGCETTNGRNTISCTIKDAGEFRKTMTIQCSEEVEFCRSKRTITKDGKTRQRAIMSASRCRAVEN